MSEATMLVPKFTLEDFMSETPYEWLYQQKDNKFLLQILLNKVQAQAKELRFTGFMKTWNAYVESKSPKATILGSNQTLFPRQPVQLDCGQYVADEYGVSRLNELGAEVEVISHPLMPVKRVTNIETFEEKLEIAYQRGLDPWKNITVSREQLASAQKIIGLSRQGVDVNSENAKEVVRYMSKLESLNYDALPRQNSVSHMGWLQDGRFMPYVDDVSYDGDSPEFLRMYSEFSPHGDENEWMKIAKEVRKAESVPARIALAAAFAAPLVQIMGGLPFFVHLWGEAGCGKTVGLMLSASVWGNPDVGRYIKTFSGTKVSMELYASFCCNLPILFDELQVVSDRKTFDDLIYMLCEGTSKGRGAKEGGLQVQKHWSSCIISTGEMPITQSNSGGGAVARTLEINYGGRPLFEDARGVANALKDHYGFAGPKFIELLHKTGVIDALKNNQKKFYSDLIKEDIHDKQVLSASILLAADTLATMGIFRDNRALTVEEIKGYLVSRTETDVNLRCYQWLIGFCAANPRKFDSSDSSVGECWGQYNTDHGVEYVCINKSVLEDLLKNKGFSAGAFIDWARRKTLLKDTYYGKGDKNNRPTRTIVINGKQVPHYWIKLPVEKKKKEMNEQDRYREYAVVEDPDLPF
jgi:hypothetical protein